MGLELAHSTGNAAVDRILRASFSLIDAGFPGRIRSVYLSGSYATGEATQASDVDGMVVFRGELSPEEAHRYRDVVRACSELCGTIIDLAPCGEADLLREGELPAKVASRLLVFGEDIGPEIPAMPLWRYISRVMQGSWFYMALVRGGSRPLTFPLDYPDPKDEFFGYERNGLRSPDGWDRPGTKAFVGGVTLAVTTLVAIQAGVGAASSAGSIAAYRVHIGDAWTPWLEELYEHCKQRWNYAIPVDRADRETLRRLCKRALGFENHYLATCQRYLLDETAQDDDNRMSVATECLQQVHFADRETCDGRGVPQP